MRHEGWPCMPPGYDSWKLATPPEYPEETWECPECGATVDYNYVECPSCGYRNEEDEDE